MIEARPAGERALLLELPDNAAAVRVARRLAAECPELQDVVPGHCTVLASWAGSSQPERLLELAEAALRDDAPPVPGATHEIPVRYDGPDLPEVAELTGLSPEEVVARHQQSEYVVGFLGFAPGFAYLLGGDERLHVPRRTEPRVRVPAGTVALGGVVLRRLPARVARRLAPDREHGDGLVRSHPPAARAARRGRSRSLRRGMNEIEVLAAGPLTTVQDRGRPGWAHIGVPPSGAVDPLALERGNRLVGNDPGAAALEATMVGPRLRFHAPALVALTGAVSRGPFEVGAGEVLEVGPCRDGVRVYVSVRGGIDVEPVLGSRSTDLMSGLGPPPLADGDVISVGAEPSGLPQRVEPGAPPVDEPLLRVLRGPRDDWFDPSALEALAAGPWQVGPVLEPDRRSPRRPDA